MLATYTGAKAFLERWSQALGEETKEFGVDVRLVLPYFVVRLHPHPSPFVSNRFSTPFFFPPSPLTHLFASSQVSNMSKIRRSSLLIPTPPAFVSATLASVGQARGAGSRPYTSTPYWSHAVFDWAMATFGLGGQFAMSKGLGECERASVGELSGWADRVGW